MPPRIVLITRVRTNNKGNQALSAAWVSLLQRAFPEAEVEVFERRPAHLLQHTLEEFRHARNPVRAFESAARKLARLAPVGETGSPPKQPSIALDESISPRPRFAEIRQRLNLRKWVARAGLYRDAYEHRLAACKAASLVVVNPAGEFFPKDPTPALYHLLDVYVAHLLGRPSAIVNHTMDVTDPTLRKLIPVLYRQLDLVGFRDEPSVDAFKAMGGQLDNVVVAPDLALSTLPPAPRPRRHGVIGLAIHTPDAASIDRLDEWLRLIEQLRKRRFQVVLVSNELPTDLPFLRTVQNRISIPIEGVGLDFKAYSALLGSLDLVVTSRMHTGILAMVAGTPVVPVEGPSFKITGLFRELELAVEVTQPTHAGWREMVVEQAVATRDNRDQLSRQTVERVLAVRTRIYDTLIPRLQTVAKRGGHG